MGQHSGGGAGSSILNAQWNSPPASPSPSSPSSPSSASSASSALNPEAPLGNLRNHRGLSRLVGLSARQLEHINTWLDDSVPYRKIVELCRTEFQIDIPVMTIARYNKRSAVRTVIGDLTDSKEALAEISQHAATGDATFSTNTLEILEQQAFDLAAAFHRDADAEDLTTLKQIWGMIHKAKNTAIRERHAKVQEQKCDLRREELALKREKAQSKNDPRQNNSDHLGRFATDWKGVGERVCKQFNISPEEEARRAELHKTWKQPHVRPGVPTEINPVDD